MKKLKLFNSYFLFLSLGFFSWGSNSVFALEDGNDLTSQIMQVNDEIMNLSNDEWGYFQNGLQDTACVSNITTLHNQFMDILAHYKPYKVSWDNYDPIKNFKVAPGNADELAGLLEAMQATKEQLDGVLAQMENNVTDCTQVVTYDTTTYVYPSYPVYTYVYPDYSSYYVPLLFGIGAWGLWGWGNVWGNGWGHGWHHWHNNHPWHHRDGRRGDGHRRRGDGARHRAAGTHRAATNRAAGTHRASGTHRAATNRAAGTHRASGINRAATNRAAGTHRASGIGTHRATGSHRAAGVGRASGGGHRGGGGGGHHGGGGGHHR